MVDQIIEVMNYEKQIPKILVVEDNIPSQKMALIFLQKFGYEAVAVDNGYDALKLLGQNHFDIVFLDIHMVGINGFDVADKIRSREAKVMNHKIPIVAMTAFTLSEDRTACLEAGMDDFISKPIKPQKLKYMVDRYYYKVGSNGSDKSISSDIDFDPNQLLDQLDNDREIYRDIMTTFIDDIPKKFEAITMALEKSDPMQLWTAAHSVKGAALNVGANSLHKLASSLEEAGANNNIELGHDLLKQIHTNFSMLREKIFLSFNDQGVT